MEVLFAFAVVLLPLILSILAYRRAGEVAEKLRRLEDEWRWSQAERERSGTVVVAPATPEQPPVTPAAPPPPSSTQRVAPPQRPAQRASVRSGGGLEALLGGRVAAFVGIAAILFGVVFFVGYAIHHGWIGPATRILLGLATGLALLALN